MNKKNLIIAVVLSLILHLFFAFTLFYLPDALFSEDTGAIEVFLNKPDGGWQLADIPEPAIQEKPATAKHLGMYNQKAANETVASSKKEAAAEKSKSRAASDLYKVDRDLFAMKSPVADEANNAVTSGEAADNERLEDFYPDYKAGAHTYINVLRYPEVEYFVRLKRAFKMTWNPVPALRRGASTMSISRGTVSVVVAVSVEKEGNLSELFVLKSSGIASYDDEAVRTVRASSPFSSPPEKFLEDDGLLRMSWTFVLYL
ncbi:MAG: energy transducer TonB [Deltaproteobacteria bacterium]|nr:energy transducer TonB [Deltaproteobacteria bacterium]MBI2974548.1 energy transducer TonB [Deltaproteobacteria bacterium]